MNKLILIFLMLWSIGAYAQDGDSAAMRKRKFSALMEAELAPNSEYKTRGISLNAVHNVSDKFSVGFGVKPYGLFFRKYDVVNKWFTIGDDGSIIQHSETVKERHFDNDFCMPVYVILKCIFFKKTNAAPFFEVRVGKDVAYQNDDLYRSFTVGSRFGFKNNYRHAVNVAAGLQMNPVDELGSCTFLFKVGYEF
ncbi:MAG: hypothetical protein IKP73_17010 [Bacteroidales bacterium]|jgi:hypothetical protein|nr:hypothetical protein [Bacteroidales bacterium]